MRNYKTTYRCISDYFPSQIAVYHPQKLFNSAQVGKLEKITIKPLANASHCAETGFPKSLQNLAVRKLIQLFIKK